jgi:hypothetical protein
MIIFIDTNIFFNYWHLQNANFIYLFNFLENTGSKLFISEVVCEEVDNKFKTEIESLKKNFSDGIKKSNSVLLQAPELDLKLLDTEYSFRKTLSSKTNNVTFLSYDEISLQTLVNRAIKKVKPFQYEDKGFRDTLIWLSLLEFLSKNKEKSKIAFINQNSSDFYNPEKTTLHDDLKNDLETYNLKNEFSVYESIKDFIKLEVNLDQHKFNNSQMMEDYIYPNERLLEEAVESFINSQSKNWFSDIIKQNGSYSDIVYLNGYKFHIFEGIEDPEFVNWSEINPGSFFAQGDFFLRLVDFEFTIPKAVYSSNKEHYDKYYYEIEIENDFATIKTVRKVFMNVSFYYDVEKNEFSNLAINKFK